MTPSIALCLFHRERQLGHPQALWATTATTTQSLVLRDDAPAPAAGMCLNHGQGTTRCSLNSPHIASTVNPQRQRFPVKSVEHAPVECVACGFFLVPESFVLIIREVTTITCCAEDSSPDSRGAMMDISFMISFSSRITYKL